MGPGGGCGRFGMREEMVMELPAIYRDDFRIRSFLFGEGKESVCIVGAQRGNEYQQLYVASLLVKKLKEIEERGGICPGRQIRVIPCANPYSINAKKRFWTADNTDINRMYPGYDLGETTQRIAAAVFDVAKRYEYGIQFASFYMPGRFLPHIRIMKTGLEEPGMARKFGFPYVVLHQPRPFDTTTLNYNWQIWETKAFSLYTTDTNHIDEASAHMAVDGVLRFLHTQKILKDRIPGGYFSEIIERTDLVSVRTSCAGFFFSDVSVGQRITHGQKLAEIRDTYTNELKQELVSPVDGTLFFMRNEPLTYQATAVFKIIPQGAERKF